MNENVILSKHFMRTCKMTFIGFISTKLICLRDPILLIIIILLFFSGALGSFLSLIRSIINNKPNPPTRSDDITRAMKYCSIGRIMWYDTYYCFNESWDLKWWAQMFCVHHDLWLPHLLWWWFKLLSPSFFHLYLPKKKKNLLAFLAFLPNFKVYTRKIKAFLSTYRQQIDITN